MNKNNSLFRPRQLQFRFEGEDLWELLLRSVGPQCQALLTQLLVAVVCQENASLQEALDHERQD
jgi:hypothetical protein